MYEPGQCCFEGLGRENQAGGKTGCTLMAIGEPVPCHTSEQVAGLYYPEHHVCTCKPMKKWPQDPKLLLSNSISPAEALLAARISALVRDAFEVQRAGGM